MFSTSLLGQSQSLNQSQLPTPPSISNGNHLDKFHELVFDRATLELLYNVHNSPKDFETFRDQIHHIDDISDYIQLLKPWLSFGDSKISNDAIYKRAFARLLSRGDVRDIYLQDQSEIYHSDQQFREYIQDVTAGTFTDILSLMSFGKTKTSSRIRTILASREADKAIMNIYEASQAASGLMSLIDSSQIQLPMLLPTKQQIVEFRHGHLCYKWCSKNQTWQELESYLDDVSNFARALGYTDMQVRAEATEALQEHTTISNWLKSSEQDAVTNPNKRSRLSNSQISHRQPNEYESDIEYERPFKKPRKIFGKPNESKHRVKRSSEKNQNQKTFGSSIAESYGISGASRVSASLKSWGNHSQKFSIENSPSINLNPLPFDNKNINPEVSQDLQIFNSSAVIPGTQPDEADLNNKVNLLRNIIEPQSPILQTLQSTNDHAKDSAQDNTTGSEWLEPQDPIKATEKWVHQDNESGEDEATKELLDKASKITQNHPENGISRSTSSTKSSTSQNPSVSSNSSSEPESEPDSDAKNISTKSFSKQASPEKNSQSTSSDDSTSEADDASEDNSGDENASVTSSQQHAAASPESATSNEEAAAATDSKCSASDRESDSDGPSDSNSDSNSDSDSSSNSSSDSDADANADEDRVSPDSATSSAAADVHRTHDSPRPPLLPDPHPDPESDPPPPQVASPTIPIPANPLHPSQPPTNQHTTPASTPSAPPPPPPPASHRPTASHASGMSSQSSSDSDSDSDSDGDEDEDFAIPNILKRRTAGMRERTKGWEIEDSIDARW